MAVNAVSKRKLEKLPRIIVFHKKYLIAKAMVIVNMRVNTDR